MGDFAGMDPEGIRRLQNALGELATKAGDLKRSMAPAIAEAGPDWVGGSSLSAVDRTWTFATETGRDLRWRLDLLLRLEGHGDWFDGFVSADLPFADRLAAQRAGRTAGTEGRRLWDAYQDDPSTENLQALHAWLRRIDPAQAQDPEYAAALLRMIGKANLVELINRETVGVEGVRGLTAAELEHREAELRPLAGLIAAAEAGGTLPADLRTGLLRDLSDNGLAALLAMADLPASLLVPGAQRLLRREGDGTGPECDWNARWAVGALTRNSEALSTFTLNKKDLAVLFHPRFLATTPPEVRQHLFSQLEHVLAAQPGETPGATRQRLQVYVNLVNLFADKDFWPALCENPQLSMVLAGQTTQYFDELGELGQAANTGESQYHPGGAWHQIHLAGAAAFLGGIMQDPAAAAALRARYREYLENADLTGAHPYGNREQRAEFARIIGRNGGLGCLLLDGIAQSDLSAERRRQAMADVVASTVEFPVGKVAERLFGEAAPIVESIARSTPAGPIVAWFDAWKDGDEAKASAAVDGLVTAQLARIKEEIARQGMPPLDPETDEPRLRKELGGMYRDALEQALRQRGG